jgi:hypothetical protein
MSTRFVTHALSCSLGKGKIALKGKRKRPWLEVVRSETERSFLKYQLKLLKELHEGPIDFYQDRLATNSYYDKERFRFYGDQLYRAYELLYPRDHRYISPNVLEITGTKGLAYLWLDQGRVNGLRGSLRGRYSPEEYQNISDYLNSLGIQATPHANQLSTIEICLSRQGLRLLLEIIDVHLPKNTYNKMSRRRTAVGT